MLLLHQASKALWFHYLPTYLPTYLPSLTLTFEIYLIRTIGQKKTHPLPTTQQFALYTPVVLPKCTDAKVPAQKKQKWSWQIALKNMALEDSWYLGFPKQKIFSTVFLARMWTSTHQLTMQDEWMNGWMNGWMMCEQENTFSLYSSSITNHSG